MLAGNCVVSKAAHGAVIYLASAFLVFAKA